MLSRFAMTIGVAGLLIATNLCAQEFCPPPAQTIASFTQRLQQLPRPNAAISGMFVSAFVPGPSCPTFSEDVNLQEALENVILFLGEQSSGALHQFGFVGVVAALRTAAANPQPDPIPIDSFIGDRRWSFVPTRIGYPGEALEFVIEHGRTPTARQAALRAVIDLLPEQQAEAYLLQQARASTGPPGFRDLPEQIVSRVYRAVSTNNASLRSRIESDTTRISDPRARCVVATRGGAKETPPGRRITGCQAG